MIEQQLKYTTPKKRTASKKTKKILIVFVDHKKNYSKIVFLDNKLIKKKLHATTMKNQKFFTA